MNELNGLNALTSQRLLIGPGAVYLNYGIGGQELLGATRGGTEYDPGIKHRTVDVDSPNGDNIKGFRQLAEIKPMIKIKALEFSTETLRRFGQFTTTVNGANDILIPREIASTDYWTNVAVIATVSGSTDPVVLLIKNALANPESIKISLNKQDEAVIDVEFTGFFDPAAMSNFPVEIRIPTIL